MIGMEDILIRTHLCYLGDYLSPNIGRLSPLLWKKNDAIPRKKNSYVMELFFSFCFTYGQHLLNVKLPNSFAVPLVFIVIASDIKAPHAIATLLTL